MQDMSTEMTWQTSSTGYADTERLGEILGSLIDGAEVIELRADLGGGKTTFMRGLAKGLGSTDMVSSPTFTLNQVYKCRDDLEIHHFDFYRLSEPGIVADQLEESLKDSKVITVVEWSDIVEDVLPDIRLIIELTLADADPDARQINFKYGDSKLGLIEKLRTISSRV